MSTTRINYRLRWRWALVAGCWADFAGGAVLAAVFAARNGVHDPADRVLLMAYGGLVAVVLLLPLNLALGGIASRIVSPRTRRPPDEILTTAVSLHFALLVAGYGLSSRASQWWFYERADGLFCANNRTGLLLWAAAAAATYALLQWLWRFRRRWGLRLRAQWAVLTAALFLSPFARAPAPPAPPVAVSAAVPLPPPDVHVLWIGIDGADWEILDGMMARGTMPVLDALCRRGVRAPLASVPPYASQQCWVTAATGAFPGQHGVDSRLAVRFPGVRPFSVHYRTKEFLPVFGAGLLLLQTGLVEAVPTPRWFWRAESLWGALSRAGRTSAVFGWPSTWPAEPVHGIVVTDRFYHSVWEVFYRHARGLPGNVHPADRLEWARSLRVDPRQFTDAQAGMFFDLAPDLRDRFRAPGLDLFRRDPVAYLGRGVGMDLTDLALAAGLLDEGEPPHLVALYTTGFDLAAHGFWIEREPERFAGVAPSGRPELRQTLDRYCRFLDAELGRVIGRAPPDTVVLISSDHGVTPSPGHPVWPVAHDATGILVLAGPPVKPGAVARDAGLSDLAPTIAWLLGAPAPAGSRGRVLAECFTPAFLATHPLPPPQQP